MPTECENCKANPVDILKSLRGADLSDKAKIVAILEAFGVTDREQVEGILEAKPSTVRQARQALKIQRQKSSGAENPAPEIQRSAEIPAPTPEIQRQKSSDPSCAGATKESPTEISYFQSQQQQSRETEVADAQQLFRRLSAAVGEAMNPLSVNMQVVAEPRGWIRAGADLDADIIPVVEAMAKKAKRHGIKSWNYFGQAVADAAAARKAGLPAANLPKTADVLPIKLSTPTFLKPKLEAANA